MTPEEFEQTLLRFKYREPFEPFVVELRDGRKIEVGHPSVLFDQDGGTYVTPDLDFFDFRRDQVSAFRSAAHGVAT